MRLVHRRIICFMLRLYLQPYTRTVLMTVGLQNRIMYVFGIAVTAPYSDAKNELTLQVYCNCFYEFVIVEIVDISYSFIHSYCSYSKSYKLKSVFALILPHVLFLSTNVPHSYYKCSGLLVNQTGFITVLNMCVKCEACWT